MAFIEIQPLQGDLERRELKKQTPITIGRHVSNDIAIDEDDVAVMHCRISWSRGGYEAVAASQQPLDVNGIPRMRVELHAGDVLRFGSVDLVFQDELSPLEPTQPERVRPERTRPEPSPAPRTDKPVPLPPIDPFIREPQAPPEQIQPVEKKPVPGTRRAKVELPVHVEQIPQASQVPQVGPAIRVATSAKPSAGPAVESPLSERLRSIVRSQQSRPGEEDVLQSPLILGGGVVAAVLLLTGAIFYFIATQQTTQQAFQIARQAYEEGNFRSSIEALQTFILNHPRDGLTPDARRLLGQARVRQLIEGGAPKYPEGLQQLRTFIEEQRDTEGFKVLHAEILRLSRTIALGAAEAAGKYFDPKLLDVSRQARALMQAYAPKDALPVESFAQIEQAQRAAQALILRDDVYQEHLQIIDNALAAHAPLQALQTRRNLLNRYPYFAADQKLDERLRRMLTEERQSVDDQDLDQSALTTDHDWPEEMLTLGFLGRTSKDEVATGQTVLMLAKDCCYGIERTTGQPVWRRVIGFETPFFPLLEKNSPGLLLFDRNHQELVRLHRETGALLWRQPIGEDLSGRPLLSGEILYVPTQSGKLLSIMVQTGQVTGALVFSQPVSGPVEMDHGQRLIVAGQQQVIYQLTTRPLACQNVFDLGQPAGSIQAPLLTVAAYLLAIENQTDRATLHLLELNEEGGSLSTAASSVVNGRVLDAPVLRGRDLFIPSSGERISTFSLSDDPGQPPLTRGPVYVSEGTQTGAAYLLPGPDRQLWMATAALSRLRLTTDVLQLDGKPIGPGTATQPLQFVSGELFHARSRPFSSAVSMTRTDRDEMISDWQTMLGAAVLACASPEDRSFMVLFTDAGQTFRISSSQITGKKFVLDPVVRLPIPNELTAPLLAAPVSRNRMAVAMGGSTPQQWTLSATGQIESTSPLPEVPQAVPCAVGDAVLYPVAGGIHVLRPAGQPSVHPFTFPSDEQHVWVSLSAVSDQQAVGVTSKGLVLLLRLNSEPKPYLAEIARRQLDSEVFFPAAVAQGLLAIVDHSRKVTLFSGANLEVRGSSVFDLSLSNRPWISHGLMLIEEGQQKLSAVEMGNELTCRWTLPLEKTSVAGVADHQGQMVIALQSGRVLSVNPENGEIDRIMETGNALSFGPIRMKKGMNAEESTEEALSVGTVDGSLIRLK